MESKILNFLYLGIKVDILSKSVVETLKSMLGVLVVVKINFEFCYLNSSTNKWFLEANITFIGFFNS